MRGETDHASGPVDNKPLDAEFRLLKHTLPSPDDDKTNTVRSVDTRRVRRHEENQEVVERLVERLLWMRRFKVEVKLDRITNRSILLHRLHYPRSPMRDSPVILGKIGRLKRFLNNCLCCMYYAMFLALSKSRIEGQ